MNAAGDVKSTRKLAKDLQKFIAAAQEEKEDCHSAKPYIEDLKRILLKHIKPL
ncbi:MAG: hypothetical protein K0R28_1678 [Paenibacillus sp.]|jgi:hypothetical protein|uniref:hypothetical protein n=1 Tax=Paenibacillus hemerocallicola TaxID=1172614 RepID=UPI00159ED5FD|nr:hypothetical protein [Paenibacillus hemerocallicola]MDF2714753.1 hypothetical protein [Paenibacillus sp.]